MLRTQWTKMHDLHHIFVCYLICDVKSYLVLHPTLSQITAHRVKLLWPVGLGDPPRTLILLSRLGPTAGPQQIERPTVIRGSIISDCFWIAIGLLMEGKKIKTRYWIIRKRRNERHPWNSRLAWWLTMQVYSFDQNLKWFHDRYAPFGSRNNRGSTYKNVTHKVRKRPTHCTRLKTISPYLKGWSVKKTNILHFTCDIIYVTWNIRRLIHRRIAFI